MRIAIFFLALGFYVNASATSCPDISVTGIASQDAFNKFLISLKAATKDPKAMTKHVLFPLRVNAKPKMKPIKNEEDLQKHFAAVFSDNVLKVIDSQKVEEIFCRDQGVMLGDGEIWIRQEKDKIGIVVINQ